MNRQASQIHDHTPTKPYPLQASGILQRKCACGNHTVAGGDCKECMNDKVSLQRKTDQSGSAEDPPIVREVLRSAGRPLDAATRAFMEPRFGHDFSGVKVHCDTKAAESTQSLNALAYTVGRDVVFGAGQYAPSTPAGRGLLAHELAHVVQQEYGSLPSGNQLLRESESGVRPELHHHNEAGPIFRKPDPQRKGGKKVSTKAKSKALPLTADEVKKHIAGNNKSSESQELLLCLIWKESGFNPKDKSSKSSATGLMQMTKGAVEQVNKSTPKGVHFTHGEMTDPAKNIQCGTYYLKIRIEWANGDVKKGLEGFGTGSGYADNILSCEACIKTTPEQRDDCLHAIHS